jgi:rhodanese-related sulfurtransferase
MSMPRAARLTPVALLALAVAGCGPTGPADAGGDLAARVEQVAATVGRGEDRVTPAQLAKWLASSAPAPRVLDLRPREAYAAGHIAGATHLALAEAASAAGRRQLAGSGRLVLYAEDGEPGARLALLLRLAGVEAYALDGGYRGWMAHLAGAAPGEAADPAAEARRLAAACRQSEAYAAARASGFLPAARAAEPAAGPEQAASPAPAAAPGAPPPPAPPAASPGFTPPLLPAEGQGAPPAVEPGGLIVNEGC